MSTSSANFFSEERAFLVEVDRLRRSRRKSSAPKTTSSNNQVGDGSLDRSLYFGLVSKRLKYSKYDRILWLDFPGDILSGVEAVGRSLPFYRLG